MDDLEAATSTLKNSIRSRDEASSKPRGNSIDSHLSVHVGYSSNVAITCDPSEIGCPCGLGSARDVQHLISSLRKHITRVQDTEEELTKLKHLSINKLSSNGRHHLLIAQSEPLWLNVHCSKKQRKHLIITPEHQIS